MEKNINLQIDYQCPQCGAPATLDETDRLFSCAFCKVNSYLMEGNYFRYRFQSNAPENKPLVYFPYWRFKGMLFSCLPGEIQDRFMDMSHQAVPSLHFPVSVGLRSQAIKLNFVTPGVAGRFIKPVTPFKDVMEIFINRFNKNISEPILHQAHIGESLSLIYSPFYVDDKVVDAVLNKPVSSVLPDDFDETAFDGGGPDGSIKFVPTLCPNCGWDLEGNKDSLALFCKNCESSWQPGKKALKKLNTAHIPADHPNHHIYLPFWRLKADANGIDLTSFADLVRIANLPKVVQEDWNHIRFHFWGPAFKVRPKTFLRLTTGVTIAQPQDTIVPGIPDGNLHSVNLPVKESTEALKLNLAKLMRPRKKMIESLSNITIKPSSYLLVYLPFEIRHHDLVLSKFNLSINKNQLALANHL